MRVAKTATRTPDEVRQIMLQFFHERNEHAGSRLGKKNGAAVNMTTLRKELKASHGITVHEVHANLTYLLSHGWVEEKTISKSFATPRGGVVPAATSYYIITADGIDKLAGPGDFMKSKFEGIRIEATGQNIITLGDGNQVDARYRSEAEALSELVEAIKQTEMLDESTKLNTVADINSIQDQLSRTQPRQSVITSLWQGIEEVARTAGLFNALVKAQETISHLL